MHRTIAAVLAAACLASPAGAQTAPPPGIPAAGTPSPGPAFSLDQALAAGGVASTSVAMFPAGGTPTATPLIGAATAGVDAAIAARRVAGLRPNPELQGQVENVIGTGAYRGLRSAETTVGVALPLELGGKRPARVALATARVDRARIAAAVARADLRLRITQIYIVAAAAERRSEVLGEQAGIAAEALRVARNRVQVGDVGFIEQERASVLSINARTAADNAARDAAAARDALSALLGVPVAGPLDRTWFDRLDAYGPSSPIAIESTLTVAAAQADVTTAAAQVRLARAQRIPDLTVGAGARRLSASGDTAAVFSVALPLPLFNNGSALVAQARAERTQAEALRALAVADVRQAIAQARAEVANAAAIARATGGPALAAAQEAARIARIGWTQGKFDQLALLDAERTLSQTRQAEVDALAAYHDAQARLARLTTPAPKTSGDDQ